jgi:putative PIN family toxin of toxin-antitoxin system
VNASKIKAVLDTQLFLRATINRRSLPAKIIFDLAAHFQLITSNAIIAEITDVLNRQVLRNKFKTLTDETVREMLKAVSEAEIVNPTEVPAVGRDSKDDIFLACAKAAEAQYLVSEDKDLLVLHPYEGIQIINALDFLNVLQSPSNIDPESDIP